MTASAHREALLRVLVVEDTACVAQCIAKIVQAEGFRAVGPAPTVASAIEAIAAENLDAALVDCTLADGECGPVLDELRRRSIPFAVLTGHAAAAVRPWAHGAPVLEKPFETAALTNLIHELLGARVEA